MKVYRLSKSNALKMSIEPSRVQVKQHTWKRHGSLRDRDIVSIADLDFYGITINCLQIPLDKILKNGFSTGHGFLRSPNSIISASALACIALQSNQNDMFGGQSIPCFEYYLAPYVAKSFAKHLISVLEVNSECDLPNEASEHIKNLCDELYSKNGTVLSKESKHEIGKYIQTLVKDVDYCIEKAIKLTDKETYQAMEAFVHNMNTLQSRCIEENTEIQTLVEKQLIFKKIKDINIGDYVLSFNPLSNEYEYKEVTDKVFRGKKKVNQYILKNDCYIICTPDHKILTDNGYEPISTQSQVCTINGKLDIVETKDFLSSNTYDITVKDNHNFVLRNGIIVKNCGSQTPFSSVNYGTGTTEECRMIIKNILLATDSGLGNHETPIFPIQIFKMKHGVNYNKGEPNYDLFELACKVSAKRLFPNFSFVDATYNKQYYVEGHPETEIALMGCRTRVIGNDYNRKNEIYPGRGNLFFVTINLPRLALEANGNLQEFWKNLDSKLELCKEQLLDRYEFISHKKVKNLPFLMGQGLWVDSDHLDKEDEIGEVIKNGLMSIGFCGLAECLKALIGEHHGESWTAQHLGLDIVNHIRHYTDKLTKETDFNFSTFASPAESTAGTFVKKDREIYGKIEGVTDRNYYTNSFHVPVYYDISAQKKIDIEAPYHELCNAGSISYIEMDGDPTKNVKAFEDIIKYMGDKNMNYVSINHPVDRCPVCGYTGIINDVCPKCGRHDLEAVSIEHLSEIGIDTKRFCYCD